LLKRLVINGNNYLGVFCRSSDGLALVSADANEHVIAELQEALEVPAVRMTIGGSRVVGALCALNSNGIVLSELVGSDELALIKRIAKKELRATRVPGRLNALGNNVLVNDNAGLVHPDIGKTAHKKLMDVLGVELVKGTIAGMRTVGSAASATNKGILCHPKTTPDELKQLAELFKVPVTVGTANYGSPMIGACVVGNSKGAVAGLDTTGIEMGRIEEAFGFL